MADTFSKEKRSDIMRRVKSFNTKPELALRHRLHRLGFRFTLHRKKLPGTPDVVLPKYHTVINVHGCFWHGHLNCKRATFPENNRPYWETKIIRNIERDQLNKQKLAALGWIVLDVYECQLKSTVIDVTIKELVAKIVCP